jgi:hypothetical protein
MQGLGFFSHFIGLVGDPMRYFVMRRVAFLFSAVFFSLVSGRAQDRDIQRPAAGSNVARTQIMSPDEVRPGMKGVAYTVFSGTNPESMGVEVLGVLRNLNGPRSSMILVRLLGEKPEYTGVVAGMSGSPVYIDGKLLGALAFKIGSFSKEPIAGVTPITEMLEINEFDRSIPPPLTATRRGVTERTSGPGKGGADVQEYAQYLQPIDAPFVFSGFNESAIQQFASKFAAAGIDPVMGVGSSSEVKQPEPLVPGSAVSAILVRGDMDVAATCTVTYMDQGRLLACGHPLLQYGQVDMPMTKANVVATLPSPLNAFKIINTTEAVGAFVQDRHTGILGRMDRQPDMIPVTLNIHGIDGAAGPQVYHYEVLNNPKLTPLMMMATVFNALQGMNQYGEETTYRMNGSIRVDGYASVRLTNMFSPVDTQPTAYTVAVSLGEHFGRIFENPFATPKIQGVSLEFDLERDRHSAVLESARTDVTEARPGDQIMIEAVLRPYRGERIVRKIPVRVPASIPKGPLRILVSDAETLDRPRRLNPAALQRLDLNSTIALLNKEHLNDHLYVSLLEANPQATVEDKVMPAVPLSIVNVMEGMRATQEMVVFGESAVNESSAPVGYVVTGSLVISIAIK